MNHKVAILRIALAITVFFFAACSSTGRTSFLLFGGSKDAEEALVDSVRSARTEQAQSQEDFSAAFRLFQRLTAPQAVELEELDAELEDAIDECDEAAEQLRERILEIRTDSSTLFTEWKAELEHFSGEALRKKSESMLVDTEERSQRVIAALERVQGKMEPVLLKFHDYELFFNHNLNPRAIATLEDTYDDFEQELDALNEEITRSLNEMNSFLGRLEGSLNARE